LNWRPFFGARWQPGKAGFRVWAPDAKSVQVLLGAEGAKRFGMQREPEGTFYAELEGARAGEFYRFQSDDQPAWPDPASRWQPRGVHGPSQLVDPSSFVWSDESWEGVARERLVLYELHVGTFTPEGTFAAAMEKLPSLKQLGVTAVELMPVADFPGERNWGYDGVALFAPARCYGAPDDLRRFVDRAHQLGLAVHLDVVYNHLGPDGSYFAAFSPLVFSQKHRSPWGAGINFDGPGCEMVRRFFIDNALHWIHEYHMDGLRLDATHAIVDDSPKHFLAELAETVQESLRGEKRQVLIVAEDDRNLARIATPRRNDGWGLDAIWADDLHHEVHRCLTGEGDGYFADFSGSTDDIATTARQGWLYCGQDAPYFGKKRGTDPGHLPLSAFVVCLQNHDQIGNRAMGERLNQLVDAAAFRAASVLLLLAPETPLLFMGQEWASSSPFQYFTDHNLELGRLVTEGRRREFARFASFNDPAARERIPDPQAESTFTRSQLAWEEAQREPHAGVLRLYQKLLGLRASDSAMADASRSNVEIAALGENGLILCRSHKNEQLLAVIQLRQAGMYELRENTLAKLSPGTKWSVVMTTEDSEFTAESKPIEVEMEQGLQRKFARPGAVIVRRTKLPPEGGRSVD
jgi:maltooligosyltrehalose trehalohydrolase